MTTAGSPSRLDRERCGESPRARVDVAALRAGAVVHHRSLPVKPLVPRGQALRVDQHSSATAARANTPHHHSKGTSR